MQLTNFHISQTEGSANAFLCFKRANNAWKPSSLPTGRSIPMFMHIGWDVPVDEPTCYWQTRIPTLFDFRITSWSELVPPYFQQARNTNSVLPATQTLKQCGRQRNGYLPPLLHQLYNSRQNVFLYSPVFICSF